MIAFKTIPYTQIRKDTKDFLDLAKGRNYVQAMSEIDVTALYEKFKERKKRGIKNNSLSVYTLWCYGQALMKHPEIQSLKAKNKLVIFEDVDVALMMEKELPDGKKQPFPYIFRSVQKRTFDELSAELLQVKNLDLTTIRKKKKSLIIRRLPKRLRMFFLRLLLKNPKRSKEVLGTVALTCLGMVFSNKPFWPLPIGPYPCILATGAVYTKRECSAERKMLCVTITIDHDIADGAPVARFGNTFMRLMESGIGLV